MKKIILDIDGVMIRYEDGDRAQPSYLSNTAVEALKHILKNEEIMIVISSTMRLSSDAWNKLKRMWISASLDWSRIIDKTPDIGSRTSYREKEIKRYIIENEAWDYCLPIDDELLFGLGYIKTDAKKGLTMEQAEQAVQWFQQKVDNPTNSDQFGFGYSYFINQDHLL